MRYYCIISVDEITKIDFNEVVETSTESLMYNQSKTKTIVKYLDIMPLSLKSIDSLEGPFTYEQIIAIIRTVEWQPPLS